MNREIKWRTDQIEKMYTAHVNMTPTESGNYSLDLSKIEMDSEVWLGCIILGYISSLWDFDEEHVLDFTYDSLVFLKDKLTDLFIEQQADYKPQDNIKTIRKTLAAYMTVTAIQEEGKSLRIRKYNKQLIRKYGIREPLWADCFQVHIDDSKLSMLALCGSAIKLNLTGDGAVEFDETALARQYKRIVGVDIEGAFRARID